jgi:hypothetical protein
MTDWRTLSDADLEAELETLGFWPSSGANWLIAHREESDCASVLDAILAATVAPLTTDDPDGPIDLEET